MSVRTGRFSFFILLESQWRKNKIFFEGGINNYELRITNYELRITSQKRRKAEGGRRKESNYELQITNYGTEKLN